MASNHRTEIVTVQNVQGLHMRPVAVLVETANKYECEITLEKCSQRVDGRSYIAILGLGAMPGDEITIVASGDDADAAVDEIVTLFQNKFGEEDEPNTNQS